MREHGTNSFVGLSLTQHKGMQPAPPCQTQKGLLSWLLMINNKTNLTPLRILSSPIVTSIQQRTDQKRAASILFHLVWAIAFANIYQMSS